MKLLPNIEDEIRGLVTYELPDGTRVKLDAHAVREYGAVETMRRMGLGKHLPTKRIPVSQDGVMIGTVPPDFDPGTIRSRSLMYQPRSGDFERNDRGWIASPQLGPGDFEAVPGFMWA